jgi:enoyl-CoA hydratase
MAELVSYARSGPVATIVMDDGKANVMSVAMLEALHAAFDRAQNDRAVAVLAARGRHFSGGFDLGVFASGSALDMHAMLKAGAELAYRLLSFPMPVVAACGGNAFPMGAFLILSSDHRLAGDGAWRIGLNEVTIGLTVPRFAVEVARQRLTPAYFNRTVVTGEMFGPAEATTAGFFDRLVPMADLDRAAHEAAAALSRIDMAAHAASKDRARGPTLSAIRAAIDSDITLAYAEERAAARDARAA